MLPAMVEVTHFYGTVNFVTVGTWDGTGYRTMLYQKKITKKYSIKYLSSTGRDIRNYVHEKSHGIS
jgi:hypothetical protein